MIALDYMFYVCLTFYKHVLKFDDDDWFADVEISKMFFFGFLKKRSENRCRTKILDKKRSATNIDFSVVH